MYFFILAGGYGNRANPLSLIKPKPLFPLHGTPLIEIMLTQLQDRGLTQGFVNLHYQAEMIRESIAAIPGIKVTYLYEEKLSGSRILRESLKDMDVDDFLLVVNGDTFMEIPVAKMYEKLMEKSADGVLLLRENSDPYYSSLEVKGDVFLGINKPGPGEQLKSKYMYTGAALLKGNVISKIEDPSFFSSLAKNNFKINTLIYQGIWLDIGDPHSYFNANSRFKAYIQAPEDNSLSKNVHISTDSRVRYSIIWENTTITHHSNISDCIITGNLTLSNVNAASKIITCKGNHELSAP